MEEFDITAPQHLVNEIKNILKYYDYKHTVTISDENVIKRIKTSETLEYKNIEDFLLNGIFYKKKKNLHFYPITNPNDEVCNFDTGPLDIVFSHQLLKRMWDIPLFKRSLSRVHNFGTFIRFAENKVQRLYWNPTINAGIPLTEKKDKDPVYELIFLMHDFGHFLLPDLVFTGNNSCLHKKFYVNWRLLGESITVVLNEMILVHCLNYAQEFHDLLKLGFDKPYKLYRIFKHIDLTDKEMVKKLFKASYRYFCVQDPSGFLDLIDKDKNPDWEVIWKEFNSRYRPVSIRGREWTEANFDNISSMANDYKKWFACIGPYTSNLDFKTIEDVIPKGLKSENLDDNEIMDYLFWYVWNDLLYPLFYDDREIKLLEKEERRTKSMIRYIVGNSFLLIKFGSVPEHRIQNYLFILDNRATSEKQKYLLVKDMIAVYKKEVLSLYERGKITANEYHNYKNIFIMIPPNILRKDAY